MNVVFEASTPLNDAFDIFLLHSLFFSNPFLNILFYFYFMSSLHECLYTLLKR
jgi:hypothetical protein